MASKKQMSTLAAIVKVLEGANGKSMSAPEIIAAGLKLTTGLKGKTPGQTFYSILYAENKKADGIVKRTGVGKFKLNPKRRTVGERKSNGSATTVKPDPKPSQRRTRSRAAAAA